MEKRETYLDAICGVIIIWMVLGHIFQAAHLTESATYLCLSQILFFFMPWFCFKAGMFEKTMPDKVCFEKNFKRLMIPYFVFTGIGCIVHPISLYIASDPEILKHAILSPVKGILVDGRTTANAPVWFLFSLFVAKMLYNRFHSKYFTPMVLVSLAIPTAMFYLGIKIPYYLAYISTTLFFYSCGAKLRNVQYQKAVLLASLAVLAFSYFVLPTFVDMHRNRLLWGIYPFWFVSSLAGIVVINNLFKKFGGGGSTRTLQSIGRNSMHYLVIHWMLIDLSGSVARHLFQIENPYAIFFIVAGTNVVFLPIASRILKTAFVRKYLVV